MKYFFSKQFLGLVTFTLVTGSSLLFYQNCSRAKFDAFKPASEATEVTVAEACASGEVAVRVEKEKAVCAPTILADGDTCPVNTYLWERREATNQVVCISNNIPSVCPTGKRLTGFAAGAVVCEDIVSSCTCPAGQNLVACVANVASCQSVTPPPPVPGSYSCPVEQYLYDIVNNQAVCKPMPYIAMPQALCPANKALVGRNGNSVVCQDLMSPTLQNQACTGSQFVQNLNGTNISCIAQPNEDFSHLCPRGSYVTGFEPAGVICKPFDPAFYANPSCTAGQVLAGFQDGFGYCSPKVKRNLPNYCPTGSIAIGTNGSTMICEKVPSRTDQGQPFVCVPGTKVNCQLMNGVGDKTCKNDGQGYEACVLKQCLSGFNLVGGQCVPQVCNPNTTQACPVANGTGARTCNNDGSAFGDCYVVSCAAGYGIVNNRCEPLNCIPGQSRECQGENGSGTQVCSPNGSGFGACTLSTCKAGYTLENNLCVDKTKPVITLSPVPSNSTDVTGIIGFTVTDTGSGVLSVLCSLDGAAAAACVSPYNYTNLPVGDHTFTVTAKDKAGNQDAKTHTWKIGACVPNSKMICDIENGRGEKTCNSSGSAFGSCVLIDCKTGFTAENGACVDKTKPALSWIVTPNSSTARSGEARFSAEDNGSGIKETSCSLTTGGVASSVACALDAGTQYKFPLQNLVPGANSISVVAKDRANNSQTISHSWTVYVCDPGAKEVCTLANAETAQRTCNPQGTGFGACIATKCKAGYSQVDGVCKDTTKPSVQITERPSSSVVRSGSIPFLVSDAESGVASIQCQLNNGALAACQSPYQYSQLTPGNYTFKVVGRDNAGNEDSDSASWVVYLCQPNTGKESCEVENGKGERTCNSAGSAYGACTVVSCKAGYKFIGGKCVDNIAPEIELTQVPASGLSPNAQVHFTASDSGSGLAKTECSLDKQAFTNCSSPAVYNGLAVGEHEVVVRVTDVAGNQAAKTHKWSVWLCAPNVAQTCPVLYGSGSRMCAADGLSSGQCVANSCNGGYELLAGKCSPKAKDVNQYYSPAKTDHMLSFDIVAENTLGGHDYGPTPYSQTRSVKIFAAPPENSTVIKRCYTSSPFDHSVSRNNNCNGADEGVLGYLSTVMTAEAPTPIYQCYKASWQDYAVAAHRCPSDYTGAEGVMTGLLGYGPPASEAKEQWVWINSPNERIPFQDVCAKAGLLPGVDQGQGICASGERRPSSGAGWDSINYRFGTRGDTRIGGSGTYTKRGTFFCYGSEQKRDYDGTDLAVAYLCSTEGGFLPPVQPIEEPEIPEVVDDTKRPPSGGGRQTDTKGNDREK